MAYPRYDIMKNFISWDTLWLLAVSYTHLDVYKRQMASYTIAHLKLGLTLAETWVTDLAKRLQIYLTNSLEEAKWSKETQWNIFWLLESITV